MTKKLLGVFGILSLGTGYRILLLDEPVRLDEAYTMLYYAVQPLAGIATDYSFPNNHLLHSMAMHFTYQWFGLTDIALRLPAFTAGMTSLVLMTWLAWDLTRDKWVVFWTALFGSTSYFFVYYSVTGRGYSMQIMFALLVAIILQKANHRHRITVLPLIGVSLCLFGLLYTIPSGIVFALPLVIGGFVMAAKHRSRSLAMATVLVLTMSGLMLLAALGPVLRSLSLLNAGQKFDPLPILSSLLTMSVDGILPLVLSGPALIIGLIALSKRDPDAAWLGAFIIFGYPVLHLLFGRWIPLPVMFERSYTPLLPFVYIAIAIGITHLLRRFWHSGLHPIAGYLIACSVAAYPIWRTVQVVHDPSRLYFPQRPVMAASRDLIRPLAAILQNGETIAGMTMVCDAAAAYYVTQARGFHGFYSLYEPQKRNLRTVYILSEDDKTIHAVWDQLSTWAHWTHPQKIAVLGPVSTYRLNRLSKRL